MPPSLPRFHARQTKLEDARELSRILAETGDVDETGPRLVRRSADGHDPQRLRGLPAIGRGVRSVSPGTDPVAALLAKERRGGR